jgi:hypothetical protein
LNKIFLEFTTPFWSTYDSVAGYQCFWKKKDLDELPANKKWLSAIIGFDRVDAYPNLIELFYTGTSTSVFEQMSDEKLKTDLAYSKISSTN